MNDSQSSTNLPPPEMSADPSVHLWYMRRDIGEIKNTLSKMENNFVTQNDFKEHLKADDDHEQRIRNIEKAQWKNVGFSSAISAILAVAGSALIEHFFK